MKSPKEYIDRTKEYANAVANPNEFIALANEDQAKMGQNLMDSKLFDTFATSELKGSKRFQEDRIKRSEEREYQHGLKVAKDKALDEGMKITGQGVSSPALQKKIDEEKLRINNAAATSYNKSLGINQVSELAMKSSGTSMGSGKLPIGDNIKKSGSQIGKHMNKYGF